ncbi:MAG: efflux RND transporter permease subunit [Akkermansia sp.]
MLSQFFIKRPKFAFVISILMMLAGTICLTGMPIAEYPEVSPPSIRVNMTYSGASPEEVAETVAAPIEEQLIGMDDLEYFSSSCTADGGYSLGLVFKSGSNDDMAMINVSNAVKAVESKLPAEVKATGYTVSKKSSDTLCFMSFTVDENKMSVLELSNWLRMNVKDRVGQIDGVSGVDIIPNRSYSMRVWMNTTRMSALNITPSDVSAAISAQNLQAAAGSVGSEDELSYATYKVTATGRLKTEEEFGDIIVKRGEAGHITRLKDIATIELGAEYNNGYSRLNGENVISMAVSRNNEANALATVDAVRAEVDTIAKTFPEGMAWQMSYDPTLSIIATMEEIAFTLVLALSLVALITFAFLQDWRATIIPIITIPISLLGAFVVISSLGYSINILTMFGLILVIGSLVDDAIVVVENVMSIMEKEGLSAREATVKSMKQITGAILATTLVTMAVYVPIAFYGGMVGIIYTQFSVTMCIALMFSTFNALTLSPALCALLLRTPAEKKKSRMTKLLGFVFWPFNFLLELFRKIYLAGCRILVNNAWLTILVFLGIVGANYTYFNGLPASVMESITGGPMTAEQKMEFKIKKMQEDANKHGRISLKPTNLIFPQGLNSSMIPTEDKGAVFVMISMEGSATAKQRTDKALQMIEERIKNISGVKTLMVTSGYSFTGGSGENNGMAIVMLDPWDERTTPDLHVTAIAQAINAACADIPSASIMAVTPPSIQGLGMTGGISMVLQASGDVAPIDLGNMVKEVCARLLKHDDMVVMARSEYNAETPEIRLEINREKAQSLDIPVNTIFNTLQSVMASTYVNDFTLNGFSFKVKIQGTANDRRTAEDILNVMVRSESGHMVPLSAVCTLSYRLGPTSYSRFEQLMSADITVMGNPSAGSGQVMELIEETVKEINAEEREKNSGKTWSVAWKDLSYQERQNEGGMAMILAMAVIFAYLFLVAQYESWTTPLPVMASVTVATLGALMGAQLFGLTLSIYVQLGVLMLIGLSAKSAILMVEFSKQEHELNHTRIQEAALKGASQRFRAVLMTAISFIFGVFPMVLATGAGAASRQEIGITTFCGMTLATCFGIFMVPALYSIFARCRDWTARKLGKETP